MSLMLLAPWTVCLDFLRNVHYIHDQLCIKEATHVLILFPLSWSIHCPSRDYSAAFHLPKDIGLISHTQASFLNQGQLLY